MNDENKYTFMFWYKNNKRDSKYTPLIPKYTSLNSELFLENLYSYKTLTLTETKQKIELWSALG